MEVDGLFVVSVVTWILPAFVLIRRWRARCRPLLIAGDALRAAFLPLLFLASTLRPSGVRSGVFIVGLALALWGIEHDVREWRRTRRDAEPAVAADEAPPRG